jgi:uncharacterized protein YjbI with pentapeptide repeats
VVVIEPGFIGCRLSRIELDQVGFPGANLSGNQMIGASFVGLNTGACKFEGATLTDADFGGCYLVDVTFKDADLLRTDLSGTIAGKVDFRGAKNLTTAQLARTRTLYLSKLDSLISDSMSRYWPALFVKPNFPPFDE